MIGFDPQKASEIINLSDDHVISMLLIIGKQIQSPIPRDGQLTLNEVVHPDKF